LSLLAIPLLFVFMRKDEDRDDNYRHQGGMAGIKGGSSRRELDEETEDEV
jgi:hypothetical protein